MSAAFLDVTGALREWGNQQAQLVGAGKPLAAGFHNRRLRSPGRGCYALLSAGDGGDGLTAEGATGWARVTATIYSATEKDAASTAALAYANALTAIASTRPAMPVSGVRLLMVANVTWPVLLEVDDEPAYAVDAVVHACAL